MADCSLRRIHAGTECIWNANSLLWPGRSGICILDSLEGARRALQPGKVPKRHFEPRTFREFLFYLFCSCWGAAPALSFGIRGCWVAPTLWTSGMRFLHAVEPTRQQTPRSTASINMRLQGLAQCRGSTVRIVYLSAQQSQRPKFYFYF